MSGSPAHARLEQGVANSLVATNAEGTREPIRYPIDSLRRWNDSIAFQFAPIGFRLRGRCVPAGGFSGRFTVPIVPTSSISGDWTLERAQATR